MALLCCALACSTARGGGSGLNTVVVINQNSTNSCEVGNYYCERREVPPKNVLRITWPGSNLSWSSGDFQTNLLTPLLAMLAARQLTSQIDYVVLSMDIPIQTINGSVINGTTSALFYGAKTDSGPEWAGITNSYGASEQIFSRARPASAPGYSFLSTMITAGTVVQAKALIDRGVASDGTFPWQPVLLEKSSDPMRNIRYHAFDNAIFNTRLCPGYSVQRTNCDSPWGQTNLLGIETGLYRFSILPNTFVPGAMADSLTSFGGLIIGYNDHTTLMAFINAGASGSYGTVTEPSPIPDKFPDPQNYFYQARGFSLAECYYQSLLEPYEGLIVGEPLAAPYQRRARGRWNGTNTVLSGTAQLSVGFSAAGPGYPLQQMDLFVDGRYFQTLTSAGPGAGNVLTVSVNGSTINWTVPPNATLASVASGLAAVLNRRANTNKTRMVAFAHGDRLELRSASTNLSAEPFFFADNTLQPEGSRFYRVVYLPPLAAPKLSGLTQMNGRFRMHVETPFASAYVIQASTNLADWAPLFTNAQGSPLDFEDSTAQNFPRRFYRVAASLPDTRLKLSPLGLGNGGAFKLHVDAGAGVLCTVDASPDLAQWTTLTTNLAGGPFDFEDAAAANFSRRFYRASIFSLPKPAPTVANLGQTFTGGSLLRVDGAVQPYVIEASADLSHWTALYTNLAGGQLQTSASSAVIGTNGLTTFISASHDTFLPSSANGLRNFTVNGTLQPGAWLQVAITKTNRALVTVAITNQLLTAAVMDLTTQLVNAINSHPLLQGADGLDAEDLGVGEFGSSSFNLRARSAGLSAAGIKAILSADSSLVLTPGAELPLNQNLSDLQPRNHLYLTAGAGRLETAFSLDTTALADGFHELTAVAYEGSHVRTQTHVQLPVLIKNTSLVARLSLLDLAGTAPVQGTYHLEVSANTTNVTAIRLFSTGGELNTISNQPSAAFTLNGALLGAGLHSFYAIVETSAGAKYRTAKQTVRLVNGH